jgi:hypothetical protein
VCVYIYIYETVVIKHLGSLLTCAGFRFDIPNEGICIIGVSDKEASDYRIVPTN